MSTAVEKQVQALQKTQQALAKIKKALKPFLITLQKQNQADDDDTIADPYKQAEVEAAISLAIGTLRYMATKLSGCSIKSSDPLRMELNKMRKMLQLLKKSLNKAKSNDDDDDNDSPEVQNKGIIVKSNRKDASKNAARHHVLDLAASERMVKAALHEPANSKSSLTDPVVTVDDDDANDEDGDVSCNNKKRRRLDDGGDDQIEEVDASTTTTTSSPATTPKPGFNGSTKRNRSSKKKSKKQKQK